MQLLSYRRMDRKASEESAGEKHIIQEIHAKAKNAAKCAFSRDIRRSKKVTNLIAQQYHRYLQHHPALSSILLRVELRLLRGRRHRCEQRDHHLRQVLAEHRRGHRSNKVKPRLQRGLAYRGHVESAGENHENLTEGHVESAGENHENLTKGHVQSAGDIMRI